MANDGQGGTAKGAQARPLGRGFAGMDKERQRQIARQGGQASGGNFRNDPARAAAAGRKGGQASHGPREG